MPSLDSQHLYQGKRCANGVRTLLGHPAVGCNSCQQQIMAFVRRRYSRWMNWECHHLAKPLAQGLKAYKLGR